MFPPLTGVSCCLPSSAEGLYVHRTFGGLWVGSFPLLCLVIALFLIGVGCPVTLCASGGLLPQGQSCWVGPCGTTCLMHSRALTRIGPKGKKPIVVFASGHPSSRGDEVFQWFSRACDGRPFPSSDDVSFTDGTNGGCTEGLQANQV